MTKDRELGPPYVTNVNLSTPELQPATPTAKPTSARAERQLHALTQILEVIQKLDPTSTDQRLGELRKGGLPSRAMGDGRRSSSTPIPSEDGHDQWLRTQERAFNDGITNALTSLRSALGAQGAVLFVMGQDIHAGDDKAQAKAMRAAINKATEELIDEQQGNYRKVCLDCAEPFKVTKNQRGESGLCNACQRPICENPVCVEKLEPGRDTGECGRCRTHRSRWGQAWPNKGELSHPDATIAS